MNKGTFIRNCIIMRNATKIKCLHTYMKKMLENLKRECHRLLNLKFLGSHNTIQDII